MLALQEEGEKMDKKYLTVRELADQLDIALVNAYKLCHCSDFPAVRVSPRRIVIPLDALDRWMASRAGLQ